MIKDCVVARKFSENWFIGTTSKFLAQKLNFQYIDSAVYRAVTLAVLRKNVSLDDSDRIVNIALRNVSSIASNSKVREMLVEKFRSLASSSEIKGVVMDGRDVGTVILPDAELKIFFIADIQIRAKRRYEEILLQMNNTIHNTSINFEQVLNDLERRDKEDFERAVSPLRKVKDSIVINTDNLSVQERVEMIAALAKVRMKN
ncbi:12607_t:CDS:2 [Entrophospora sp. SA101]|nr:12607_t:CDS:2 [Entrophospora sp. SA101]